MRTSHQIIAEIYHREGPEQAEKFLHKLLRHTTRCCAIPDARRFLAGIELRPLTVGDIAEDIAEAPDQGEPLPPELEMCPKPNRTDRILHYLARANQPLASHQIYSALGLKRNDCTNTLTYLVDIGQVVVTGTTVTPSGHKARLYTLNRPTQEATHATQ